MPHGPCKIVALGGGTGMPAVLRGLRGLLAPGDGEALTAIVAMSDDGGSSGRLRRSRGLPPPGDVRNCLVALSEDEDLLAGLFQHRYDGSEELGGHSVGNLILAALAEQTGSFLKAVEVSSRVLRTRGRILPVTLEDVTLQAEFEDGRLLVGESAIGASRERVTQVTLVPSTAQPTPGVVEAICDADLIALGPGSLFTSLLPTIVLDEVRAALRKTRAVRVLVANLVSDRHETIGLEIVDHIRILEDHVGGRVIDAVLAHDGPVDQATLARYRAEGAQPLTLSPKDREALAGRQILLCDLRAAGDKLRHDPARTASALLEAWDRAKAHAASGRA